jgi:hypothetical protein
MTAGTLLSELAEMIYARMLELDAGRFDPPRGEDDNVSACENVVRNDGYWAPWLNLSSA